MIENERRLCGEVDVKAACRCLGVSRSGYGRWRKRNKAKAADTRETSLKNAIHDVAARFPRYGYRRITKALHRSGEKVNHKRVQRIMRQESLSCKKRLFHPQTTDSNHSLTTYPNLAKDLKPTDVNQLWVSDITYIQQPHRV